MGWSYVRIGLAFVLGLVAVVIILGFVGKVGLPILNEVGSSFEPINDTALQTQQSTIIQAGTTGAETLSRIVKIVFGGLAILMVLIAIGVFVYKEYVKGKLLSGALR